MRNPDEITMYELMEQLTPAAEHLGISREQAAELCLAHYKRAKADALEMVSDPDVPDDIVVVVRLAELITGQKISAIKRDTCRRNVTQYPAGWTREDRWEYNCRRLSGQRRADDPEHKLIDWPCWYAAIAGNPIMIEGFLRDHGYADASAIASNICMIAYIG